jgi:hypothetical protein
MYVFIIATLLLGYVLLAIVGLLHVAKDLLGRPWSPVPSEQDLDEELPQPCQPVHREYSQ